MNKQSTQHSKKTPLTNRQMRLNNEFQAQKFTPASRTARVKSWHQRMQGLFSRQSY